MKPRLLFALALSLLVAACGDDDGRTPDTGVGGSDAGGGGSDAGGGADAGPGPSDPCVATPETALSTVGCNGFASGEPAPNGPLGACTGGSEEEPAGSCTTANTVCADGTCLQLCPRAETYVSTGDCSTGFRCFPLMDFSLCFRDCNAANPCPSGYECDDEGSCLLADE